MRMLKFRVQNYKKIEDSGWIHTKDISVFVGKNEAGKSAIFRGLSKLNPSDGSKYDGLKEFPRRRYTEEFKHKNWPVSSVEFEFDSDEQGKLRKIAPSFPKIISATVTRHYDNECTISYDLKISSFTKSTRDYVSMLEKWKDMMTKVRTPEGKGEEFQSVKDDLNSIIDTKISSIDSTNDDDVTDIEQQVSTLFSEINSKISEDWMEEILKEIVNEISSVNDKCKINFEKSKVGQWVSKNIPKFIYFDRYDVLDSAINIDDFSRHLSEVNETLYDDNNDDINIDDFSRHLSEEPDEPKLRITKCLFVHAGLDIDQIRNLDPNNEQKTEEELKHMADERAIEMSAASQSMTEKFTSWWEQRKHEFHYQIDGKHFRVWVADDLDPSKIELDQRSAGMQYFFSFYLVFLVEARGKHANSILLLDEPGMQFHGTAQQKTVEFLNKISKDNQLLYTTHSPFMIDGDHLENVKIVYEDESNYGVTKVSDNVWPKDKDSLFPLQAGLGYSLAQTLFYSKFQFVVEGLTDYNLLKAMNELLSQQKMTVLNPNIIISPAGGTKNLMHLASMLTGHKIKITVLLDGDEQGIQKEKSLKERLLVNSVIADNFTGKEKSEIEDFFEESVYVDAVKDAYADKDIEFTDAEQKIGPIVDRVEAMFKRKGYDKLEKWKVSNVLVDWISKQSSEKKISDDTCKKFEELFKQVNKIVGK